ncbi:RNA binding protein [Aureococcus anophagefferens]|uniref:RNA binding protein n=1 Tax=Aureococcus anophagefferens TaxID=44056 RepID=A0ABR1FKU1_AURAN
MSSFGLGETFAPAKSSGSASALFSGGGAPARAAKAAPAKAASKKGYDDAVDRVLAKGKKRRRPDDDGFVTATAELAARVNAAPKKAKAPAPAKPAAARRRRPKPARRGAQREDEDRTVFVGNVPTEATKKQLRTFFKTFGAVATVRTRRCRRPGVKVDDAGNDAREARLRPEAPAQRREAHDARLRRLRDGGRRGRGRARGRTARLRPSGRAALAPPGAEAAAYVAGEAPEVFHLRVDLASGARDDDAHLRTAFVGNAPRDLTEEGLRSLFAAHLAELGGHGAIDNVRVVRRKEDHLCIGVAYVMLRDKATLGAALELDGALYAERPAAKKRPLRVKTCGKRTKASLAPEERSQKPAKAAPSDRGAKRRLEKKALRAASRAAKAGAGAAAPRPKGKAAAAPKPWQGKKAGDADAAKAKKATDAKKKKRKANPDAGKKFVGKKPKP